MEPQAKPIAARSEMKVAARSVNPIEFRGPEKVALVYPWSHAFRTTPPGIHRHDQLQARIGRHARGSDFGAHVRYVGRSVERWRRDRHLSERRADAPRCRVQAQS